MVELPLVSYEIVWLQAGNVHGNNQVGRVHFQLLCRNKWFELCIFRGWFLFPPLSHSHESVMLLPAGGAVKIKTETIAPMLRTSFSIALLSESDWNMFASEAF